MQGWVDLVGWLHTEMVYPPKDGHPSHSTNRARRGLTFPGACVVYREYPVCEFEICDRAILTIVATRIVYGVQTPRQSASCSVLFCSVAVFGPRVGHTMDVLSSFVHLSLSFWLTLHGESCPRLDVVHPGRALSSSPVCTWHCSLHYHFLQATPLFPHAVHDNSMLASSLWRCLTVPSLPQLFKNPLICFLCCPWNPQNLSQSFHLKSVKTCFFILSGSPAFTAVRCYRPH